MYKHQLTTTRTIVVCAPTASHHLIGCSFTTGIVIGAFKSLEASIFKASKCLSGIVNIFTKTFHKSFHKCPQTAACIKHKSP